MTHLLRKRLGILASIPNIATTPLRPVNLQISMASMRKRQIRNKPVAPFIGGREYAFREAIGMPVFNIKIPLVDHRSESGFRR